MRSGWRFEKAFSSRKKVIFVFSSFTDRRRGGKVRPPAVGPSPSVPQLRKENNVSCLK
jgi:hypothetical protein